eukprot:gene6077-6780_t
MYSESDGNKFISPPEAPVFEPNEEEFKDPLAFIAKIRPFAEKIGLCKIRPPPDWQPRFCVDIEKFKFTPRIQRLNELEVKSRVKLNFLDMIAKFWELQGSTLKLPNVDKKPLDLHLLHKVVQEEGGYEDVTRLRKWARVAQKMGFSQGDGKGYPMLRTHYEKILFPLDVFKSGAMTGDLMDQPVPSKKRQSKDADYAPHVKIVPKKEEDGEEFDIKDVDYERNSELKKLKFLAPGPKMLKKQMMKEENEVANISEKPAKMKYDPKSNIKEVRELTRRRPARTTRIKKSIHSLMVDDYMCQVCDKGDSEESMLLCDGCDSSYHTFCLIPPLNSVPPGDWRCPKCVAQECNKPHEAYGFEQAKTLYSLREFGVMADKFKEDYFGVPAHEVPTEVVEEEFWRLVNSLDDEVVVEYGADLHTIEHGSGFPTEKTSIDPEEERYAKSWWNLNNMPVHDKSVLCHINADISGMKVPWIYVGMCFSSFCWHIEDHWSYSINYLHWGEPKTWYGVPGNQADKFESCMKDAAPELFEAQPDLLHHLVTIINPNILMNNGVPIVRTNQYAGEFVITFPRSYHAGFNQGYNFAEAVNFCPADWLPIGRKCMDHYRTMLRCPVFSHEELICKMASNPDSLDLDMAKAVYEDMEAMVKEEVYQRLELNRKGVTESDRIAFELLPDDERQCSICKTSIFLSAIVCSCSQDRISCLYDADELCPCGIMKKSIRYRYTLDELPSMLSELKKRADSFDNWCKDVQLTLHPSNEEKQDYSDLKELLTEAEQNQFPFCDLLDQLKSVVSEAEQCAQVATQLFAKKHKTRHSNSASTSSVKLTLQELKDFVEQVNNLPCTIKESRLVSALMGQVENFQYEASCVLKDTSCNIDKLNDLLQHGIALDIELPELNMIKQELRSMKWLEKVTTTLGNTEHLTLDTLRTLIDQGMKLHKKPVLEKPLRELKELLFKSDRWEEKAKLCLQAKPRHASSTIEAIINEAMKVRVILPNVTLLGESLKKAADWSQIVERIQSDANYPYLDVLECLVIRGRPISVRLDQLPQMESQIAAAKAWKERTSRTFVKKGSSRSLIEILNPRNDVGKQSAYLKVKKRKEKDEKEKDRREKERSDVAESINFDNYIAPDSHEKLGKLREAETIEVDSLKRLRNENLKKIEDECLDIAVCACRKVIDGFMMRCCLCYEWFHTSCISLPKSINGKSLVKGNSPCDIMKEIKYLCPLCCRSRRPRVETIISLLVSLQKLPVRLPEGEALQFLLERIVLWQEKAKLLLEDASVQKLLAKISSSILSEAPPPCSSVASVSVNKKIIPQQFTEEKSNTGVSVSEAMNVVAREVTVESKENSAPPQHINNVTVAETVVVDDVTQVDATRKAKDSEDALSLECEEKLTESPKASPDEYKSNLTTPTAEETLLSSSTSPVDVCTLNEENRNSKTANQNVNRDIELALLDEIEELLMQGLLLETTMDETHQLWSIVQNQRPLQPSDCRVLDSEYRKLVLKNRKKKKRKLEEDSKQLTAGGNTKTSVGTTMKANKTTETGLNGSVMKKSKSSESGGKSNKDDNDDEMETDDQDDYDEDCAFRPCKQPTGDEVGWVQCDPCGNWYHVLCIGITAEVADAMDTYICASCVGKDPNVPNPTAAIK